MKTEQLFYEAFHNYPVQLPLWLYKFERATRKEDDDGIDAWAYTTYGYIPIQIKSSTRGAQEYRERRPECRHVVTLVLSHHDCPEHIRALTIKTLERHFAHLKKIRQAQRKTARR